MKLYIWALTAMVAGLVIASPETFAQLSMGSHSRRSLNPVSMLSTQLGHPSHSRLESPRSDLLRCSPAPCVLGNVLTSPNPAVNTIIAVNPTNPMQLLSGAELQGCALAYGSADGGSSWYFGNLSCLDGGDPVLAYGRDGTAYLAGGSNDILLATTQDNGNTWSEPTIVVSPIFNGGSVLTPWLVVDNTKSSPFYNRLYIAATQQGSGQVQSQVSVSHSSDGGQTWTITTVDKVQTEPNLDEFSRLSIASDGTVYAAWQRCTMTGRRINCGGAKAYMLLSKSSDGGNTWSSPQLIGGVRLVPDSCDCAFFGNLPHTDEPVANPPLLAVDDSGGKHAGNLYAVMYNWTGKQMQVQVVTSTDHGQSWGTPVTVAPASATHDQFFPSLSVSSTGVVGVSWLDRRNDKHNVRYQPFAAYSTDGGASFSDNFALAKPLSNPFFMSTYMGEYTGNTWAGGILYAAWPDTRNLIMQEFVGGLR
ncbi:MAG: sialidase family protein, partial [Terriglobales bacterium]